MAFVFKAQKQSSVDLKENTPGPGEYGVILENKAIAKSVPFLSKSPRFIQYDHAINNKNPDFENIIQNSENISLSDNLLLPVSVRNTVQVEEPMPSANFISKVERFTCEDKKKDTPGPGSYYPERTLVKKKIITLDNSKLSKLKKILPRNKSVPSIPSKAHVHGYNEEWNGELVLNEKPPDEPKDVLEGRCHSKEIYPQSNQKEKQNTAAWSKFSQKSGEAYIPKFATFDNGLGPGSYHVNDLPIQDSGRASAGFVSTTGRSSYLKTRKAKSTKRLPYRPSLHFKEIQETANYAEMFENKEDEEEEYIKEATPGPGYYYNSSTASSFKIKINSRKSESERSGKKSNRESKADTNRSQSERVIEKASTLRELGPGCYQVSNEFLKKNKVFKPVPFQSFNTRFPKEIISETPGPGFYNIKLGKDSDKFKGNLSLTGFGGATQRFTLPQGAVEEDVGPGVYDPKIPSDLMKDFHENKRPSAIFLSKPNRDISNNTKDKPPVGTYNTGFDDIGMRVMKDVEENKMFGVKKPGFSSSKPRFKNPAKIREGEEDDEEINWKATSYNRVSLRKEIPRSNSAFASKTKRLDSFAVRNINPGPGSYYAQNQPTWNKNTFNIQFIGV